MFRLRDASKEDYDFLYNLLKSTMKQYYIEAFKKWDETLEKQYFDESFSKDVYKIIIWADYNVGCISITETDQSLFINEFQILPEFQNRGIGKIILKSIIEESNRLLIPIKLEVLKVNKKARAFYSNFGFIFDGQKEYHDSMYRNPCRE
ncbi:acetyltransferase, GNAT family [Chitinispirillum alkaliphilum]|nr:acetyltransferase, GNAT family [Chitinispirillum alkaliphilum]